MRRPCPTRRFAPFQLPLRHLAHTAPLPPRTYKRTVTNSHLARSHRLSPFTHLSRSSEPTVLTMPHTRLYPPRCDDEENDGGEYWRGRG